MGQYPSAHWRRASVAQGDEADFAHRSETETNRTRRVSLQHTVEESFLPWMLQPAGDTAGSGVEHSIPSKCFTSHTTPARRYC